MFPTVLNIGNLHIYSYGVMLFISFLCGIAVVEYRAKKFGVDPKKITDLALWVLLAVVVGSRLFYVAFHWGEFKNDLIGIIAFWRGGLAGLMFYGGFLGGIIAGFLFVYFNKLPVRKLMDAVAPAVVLGEGFTRIGCFLNGCCFGAPTCGPLGMVFPSNSPAGATFLGQPIHPTQLYSSAAGFVLFAVALLLEDLGANRPQRVTTAKLILQLMGATGLALGTLGVVTALILSPGTSADVRAVAIGALTLWALPLAALSAVALLTAKGIGGAKPWSRVLGYVLSAVWVLPLVLLLKGSLGLGVLLLVPVAVLVALPGVAVIVALSGREAALWFEGKSGATARRRGLKPGVLAAVLLIVYSLFRFLIDFVRYYENSANLWGNQIVALCLTAVGVALLILFLRWPYKQARPDAGVRK